MRPNFTEETANLIFKEKSQEYPGGRIALLADGKVVFPEVRFHPQVGKGYPCRVRFYEKRDTVIGIAYHEMPATLSDEEYPKEEQLVVAVTFVKEREESAMVARHPISGAYIVPTEGAANFIKPGIQCWVMVVQRGTSLVAHYIKDVEGAEAAPPPTRAIARRDPSFAARAEEALQEKGMGPPPMFRFKDKQQFPWEILGIGRDASLEAIRKAYRSLAKDLHPDQNPGANPEDFVSLAHAGDWLTFRRIWVDEVTSRKKRPTGHKEAEAAALVDPAPPPTHEAAPAEKPAARTPRRRTAKKRSEAKEGNDDVMPSIESYEGLGENLRNGELEILQGLGIKDIPGFLAEAEKDAKVLRELLQMNKQAKRFNQVIKKAKTLVEKYGR